MMCSRAQAAKHMQEVLKMKFDNVTIKVPISKERLLYCFKADTVEEFDRRLEQLKEYVQNYIELEFSKELCREVIQKNEIHK